MALNQGLRHLAAELQLKSKQTSSSSASTYLSSPSASSSKPPVVLAIHPGEVATDMASNVDLAWEVEGIISPEESIRSMLKVIADKGWGGMDEGGVASSQREGRKGEVGEATFWTWEGRRYPW